MNRKTQSSYLVHVAALVGVVSMVFSSGCCVMGNGACGGGGGGPLFASAGTGCGGAACGGCDSCGGGGVVAGIAPGGCMGGCDGGCSGGCDGGAAGGQFPGSCGTCASGCGGGLSGMFLPLLSSRLACGAGCGGVYWNEWVSDPPECCDPCNDCGCWVGPQCGGCSNGGCGPCGLITGAWHGITGLFTNFTTSSWLTGVGGSCGCSACTGGGMTMGCDSMGGCSTPGCTSCAQATPAVPQAIQQNITIAQPSPIPTPQLAVPSTTVATANFETGCQTNCQDCATCNQATVKRHPHRVVNKRLRR